MAIEYISYSSGTHVGWTNPTYAYDANDATTASRTLPKNSGNDSANYLLGLGHNNGRSIGSISKVELGVSGQDGTGYWCSARIVPVFGGSTPGSTYATGGYYVKAHQYVDITNDGNAPGTWSWTDVNNLDSKIWGLNTNTTTQLFQVFSILMRVTYELGWTGKINGVTNPAKINGIEIINIKNINGVE